MTEKVKRRLCELAGEKELIQANDECSAWKIFTPDIRILINAMWAINRAKPKKNKWFIEMYNTSYKTIRIEPFDTKNFFSKNHNNSEKQTLTAALEYIINNEPAAESATNEKSKN